MTCTVTAMTQADFPGIAPIIDATDLFPSDLLPQLFEAEPGFGAAPALWRVARDGRRCLGFLYAEPETFADGTWNMRALGVAPEHQGQGIGTALVAALETELQAQGARVLIVDTAGVAEFDGARAFYTARGFVQEAQLRDYWAEGVDKVTFLKRV